jgi:hypothetical protein
LFRQGFGKLSLAAQQPEMMAEPGLSVADPGLSVAEPGLSVAEPVEATALMKKLSIK